MKFKSKSYWLAGLLTALALLVSACGDPTATSVPPTPVPPTATIAAPTATPVPALDMKATVDKFLTAIPEGFYNVGKADALKDLMTNSNALVVDVREPNEYADGHIPGAINIPVRTLTKNLDKLPKDKPVVVYCGSSQRSGMATASLQILGYTNVRNFSPAFKGWTGANEAASKDPVEAKVVGAPQVDPQLFAAVDKFLTNLPDGYLSVGKVDALKDLKNSGNLTLVDVREPNEYADGHIPGAINIPIRNLAKSLDKLPKDQPVVLYCGSNHRSSMSTASLQLMGYSNVRSFSPSIAGWKAANEPIEK